MKAEPAAYRALLGRTSICAAPTTTSKARLAEILASGYSKAAEAEMFLNVDPGAGRHGCSALIEAVDYIK
jgi:hypothetical protein